MRKEIVHLEKLITMRIKLLIIGNCNNTYTSLELNVLVHIMPILWLTVTQFAILKERYFMILTK